MSELAVNGAAELTRKYDNPENISNRLMAGAFTTGLVVVPIFEFSAFVLLAILSLQWALVFLAAIIAVNIVAMYLCQRNIKPVKATTVISPQRVPRFEEQRINARQDVE